MISKLRVLLAICLTAGFLAGCSSDKTTDVNPKSEAKDPRLQPAGKGAPSAPQGGGAKASSTIDQP
jgi:PBP1b-binding outer membrane lipoprotein LpoB